MDKDEEGEIINSSEQGWETGKKRVRKLTQKQQELTDVVAAGRGSAAEGS